MTFQAFQMIVAVIQSLAAGRGKTELAEQLGLVNDLVDLGEESADELDALAAEIRAMVEVGRDPTPTEIGDVRARRAELSARLRGQAQPEAEAAAGATEAPTGPTEDPVHATGAAQPDAETPAGATEGGGPSTEAP